MTTATTGILRPGYIKRSIMMAFALLPVLVLTLILPASAAAPVASSFTATPDSFSPDSDSYQDTSSATYSLDIAGTVTLDVVSSVGAHVRSLAAGAAQSAGARSVSWDGKDDASALVADAGYKFVLVTADETGDSNTVTTDVTVNRTLGEPSTTAATFSPNGDTYQDGSNIKFDLAADADVTVWVTDKDGATVDTIAQSSRTAGDHTVTWDGKNAAGDFVAEGAYSINVSASNDLGIMSRSVSVTADNPPANDTVKSFWSSIDHFSPNRDGIKDSGNVKFSLKRKAQINIWVVNKKGKTIARLSRNKWRKSGFYAVKWNGRTTTIKSASGKKVADGTYTIKFTALSSRGLSSKSVKVYVDTKAPKLGKVANLGTVAPFEDGYKDSIKIPFKITQAGTVYLRITDPWGRIQYNKSIGHYKKGSNKFWWNGQNQNEVNMPLGRYRYSLSMLDDAGNRGSTSTKAVSVSNRVGRGAYTIGRIVVDISSQTLTAYDTAGLKRFSILISSGLPGSPTLKGNFKAIKKQRILIARSLTVIADYPTYFFPGYAIHGWPKTWGGSPLGGIIGTRRSHGCVRSETPYAKFIQSHTVVWSTKIKVQS